MRQLVYTMFISNTRLSFHVWRKENLVKHQKVSKYYATDCSSKKCEHFQLENNQQSNANVLTIAYDHTTHDSNNITWCNQITDKKLFSSKGIPNCEVVDKFNDDLIEGVETKVPVSRHHVDVFLSYNKNTKAISCLQWSSVIFVETRQNGPNLFGIFILESIWRFHLITTQECNAWLVYLKERQNDQ